MTPTLARSTYMMRAVFKNSRSMIAVFPINTRRSLMNMPPSIAGLPSTLAAPKSNNSSSNSNGVQSCQTPDDWIDDANAELAEWFGEEQQNNSKRAPSRSAADEPSSGPSKLNLTEFLLKQKRGAAVPTTAATLPPQTHPSVAPNSSGSYAPSPSDAAAGPSVVHHHTHTHYHHYPAPGGVVSSNSNSSNSNAPAVFASRATIEAYARRWINLWNARDLEGVLRLFSDRQCVFVSPRAQEFVGNAVMKNKAELRAYWSQALKLIQILEFEYLSVLHDTESRHVQVIYRARTNGRGYRAVELWELDEEGLIVRGEALEGVTWKFDNPSVQPIDPTVPGYGIGDGRKRE